MTVLATRTLQDAGTFFPVVPVTIGYGDRLVQCHALLDSGSSISLMNRVTADLLGIPQPNGAVSLKFMDGQTQVPATKVTVRVQDSAGRWRPLCCRAVHKLSLPRQTVSKEMLADLNVTAPVPLLSDVLPVVLIGLDNGHLTTTVRSQKTSEDGVFALKTTLGWTLVGAVGTSAEGTVLNIRGQDLESRVLEYINADVFGLGLGDGQAYSVEDSLSLKLLESQTRRIGSRFECPLLWRTPLPTQLPDSRSMALNRHVTFMRKLHRDPSMYWKVAELVRQWQAADFLVFVDFHRQEPGET